MTGTYLSKTDGDTYRVWFVNEDGDQELIAEGFGGAHEIADVEAHHRWDTRTRGEPMSDLEVIQNAAWQFNEAVSLLREARHYVPEATSTADDIDDGLPAIDSALYAIAKLASEPKP